MNPLRFIELRTCQYPWTKEVIGRPGKFNKTITNKIVLPKKKTTPKMN